MTAKRPSTVHLARHLVVVVAFVAACTALGARIVYLNVTERDFLKEQGDARSIRAELLDAHRGLIRDRRGEPLAVSTPVSAVWLDPSSTRLSDDAVVRIADVLELDAGALSASLARSANREFLYIKRRVAPETVAQLRALGIGGLGYRREYRRYYPAGEVASHVVGLTDIDDAGIEGVELAFDQVLQGRPGRKQVLRDLHGGPVRDIAVERAPVEGGEVDLSLDLRLQFFAHRELRRAVVQHGATSASMVVLDARTGEILVLINQPSYNPNELDDVRFEHMRNRAVTDRYEPGSTMKPFTVLAALEDGRFDEATVIDTHPGYMNVSGKLVEDPSNRGALSLAEIIKHSSQVGIAKLALDLPDRAVFDVLSRSGIGGYAFSGLPGEVGGTLSDSGLRSDIVRVTLAYGYGLSATPLQLAQSYLTLATHGVRMPVSLLKIEHAPVGQRVYDAAQVRQILTMMERVTEPDGTAPGTRIDGYAVAGKTGTARKVGAEGYDDERHVALFAGIAPAEEPRLVGVVVVNEPRGEVSGGGTVAAPVFARVMNRALQLLNIERALPPAGRALVRKASHGGDAGTRDDDRESHAEPGRQATVGGADAA